MDVGLGGDARDIRPSRHRRAQLETVDHEGADPDIEAGQDRLVRLGAKLRRAIEQHERRCQPVDVEPVVHPAQRAPVEPDLGRLEEAAVQIVEADIAQGRTMPDRSIDPPDPDPQAARRMQPGDAIDDQPVAGPGIDPPQADRHRSQRDRDQQADRAQDAHPPSRAAPRDGLGLGLVDQKACPSDT